MMQEQLNIISLDARLLLEKLIQILPFPGYIKSAEGRYLTCNDIFSDLIFGASSAEIINKSLDDFKQILSDEEIQEMKSIDSELINNGGTAQIESEIVCADGVEHYFHEIKTAFRIDSGNSGIIGIMIDLTETKEIKEAFLNQEKYFKIFMDYIPDAVYFKDNKGNYIKANTTEVIKLGKSKEKELLGKRIDEFYPAERAEKIIEEERKIIKTGEILEKEEFVQFPDRKLHYVHTTKVPFPDNKGQIAGLFGISRDITNKKINEDDLNYKFKFEKMLTKISHNLMRTGLKDFERGLEYINRKLKKFFRAGVVHTFMRNGQEIRYSFSLIDISKTIINDSSSLEDYISEFFGKETNEEGKRFKLFKEGKSEDKSTLLLPFENEGQITGVLLVKDIELDYNLINRNSNLLNILIEILENSYELYSIELKRKELEKRMSKMVKAVEQSANIVMIMDSRLNVEYVNNRFFEITGYSTNEIIGERPLKYVIGATEQLNTTSLLKSLKNGKEWKSTFSIAKRDGVKIWLNAVVSPIFNSDNRVENYIAIMEDVTEKIRTQNQRAISQKLESIGQLASGIAHEINTPMQFINDNTKFLADSFKQLMDYMKNIEKLTSKDETLFYEIQKLKKEVDYEFISQEIPEAIKQSKEGIDRVSKIVKAMKTFAHPGESVSSLNNINEAIKNTVQITKNEWKYYSDLELKLDENAPLVFCHIDSINQVILNMIINAAHANEEKVKKFGGSKEKIIISTKADDNVFEIIIEDTGTGIPGKYIDKIFDPFFTTKGVGKGTGQGLAIAHDIIVNKHKGNIFVESEEHVGSKFVIQIPVNNKEES